MCNFNNKKRPWLLLKHWFFSILISIEIVNLYIISINYGCYYRLSHMDLLNRTNITMDKRKGTNGQTTIYKTLPRKLKVEQHEHHYKIVTHIFNTIYSRLQQILGCSLSWLVQTLQDKSDGG
jgi:hypothetical protein